MSSPGFVHLRVHSAYSLLEGALPIGKLIDLASKDEQPAITVTDSGNLFGALEFSEKAFEAGLQPIIGCQICVSFDDQPDVVGDEAVSNLVLLAVNEEGYENLMDLVSRSFLDTEPGLKANVPLARVLNKSAGLMF